MADFNNFVTDDNLIDGTKITPATKTARGAIKCGSGLQISSDGVLSVNSANVIKDIPAISNAEIDDIVI